MRFLSFNLWHGLSPASPVAMRALEPAGRRHLREQRQLEVLRQIDPDIAFFQEVNPVSQRAPQLASALGAVAEYQPDLVGTKLFGIGLPLNLNSGLVTATKSKFGMKFVDAISLSRPGFKWVRSWASWQLREERFALFTETMLPGWGRVLLVNTHVHHGLENNEDLEAELARASEELELSASAVSELKERLLKGNTRRAQEMAILMRAIQKHQKRYEVIVMGGDFNSRPTSVLADMLRELGFRDAWHEVHPNEPGFSFDSRRNPANHLLQRDFPLTLVVEDLSFSAKIKETLLAMARRQEASPRRIDYIWMRSNSVRLEIQRAELTGLPDEEGFAPSDHFGVCVDVELR